MYGKFQGFMPDADFADATMWVDCDLILPTLRGFAAMAKDANAGLGTAPSTVSSMISFLNDDGTSRTIGTTAGSASAATSSLYDVITGSWVSRDGADGPYTASSAARWVFAEHSGVLFAAQRGHGILKSTAANTAFTAVAGAPQASIIITVLDVVMAFNTVDGTYGDDTNRWWSSATNNPGGGADSWTADVATQANTGLIVEGNGPITAAATVGSRVVVFKRTGAFLGQYVGSPQVWAFERIPGEGLGAWSHYSVVDVEGTGIMFPGQDNFYIFDGSRAIPIGSNKVAEFFLEDLDVAYAGCMTGLHERQHGRVFWWYPSNGGALGDGTLDRFLCFNYRTGTWGFGRKTISFPFTLIAPGITYGELGTAYSTYADMPTGTYGRVFAGGITPLPAVVGTDGVISSITGEGSDCYYTTGYGGKDGLVTNLTRNRPRFMVAPTTGSQDHSYVDQLGATKTTSLAGRAMVDGAFDHVFSARWHQVKHSYTGSMELTGIDWETTDDSLE